MVMAKDPQTKLMLILTCAEVVNRKEASIRSRRDIVKEAGILGTDFLDTEILWQRYPWHRYPIAKPQNSQAVSNPSQDMRSFMVANSLEIGFWSERETLKHPAPAVFKCDSIS